MDRGSHYPSRRYHPELGNKLVMSAEEDRALGPDWYTSPAHFGVETCPGRSPDPAVLAAKLEFERKKAEAELSAAVVVLNKKRGKPARNLPEPDGAA